MISASNIGYYIKLYVQANALMHLRCIMHFSRDQTVVLSTLFARDPITARSVKCSKNKFSTQVKNK
jgi:hypothetical protein